MLSDFSWKFSPTEVLRLVLVADPEHRLPLDNHEDFPAPISDLEERRRQSSLSDTASLASPPNPSPLGTCCYVSACAYHGTPLPAFGYMLLYHFVC